MKTLKERKGNKSRIGVGFMLLLVLLSFCACGKENAVTNEGSHVPDAHDALQKQEMLFLEANIGSVESYQGNLQFIEGEVTGIGYPTADGTPASDITTGNDCYAISARSDCKKGQGLFILLDTILHYHIGIPV